MSVRWCGFSKKVILYNRLCFSVQPLDGSFVYVLVATREGLIESCPLYVDRSQWCVHECVCV